MQRCGSTQPLTGSAGLGQRMVSWAWLDVLGCEGKAGRSCSDCFNSGLREKITLHLQSSSLTAVTVVTVSFGPATVWFDHKINVMIINSISLISNLCQPARLSVTSKKRNALWFSCTRVHCTSLTHYSSSYHMKFLFSTVPHTEQWAHNRQCTCTKSNKLL